MTHKRLNPASEGGVRRRLAERLDTPDYTTIPSSIKYKLRLSHLQRSRRVSTLLCQGLRGDGSVRRVKRGAEDPHNIAAPHAWLLKHDLRGFDPTDRPPPECGR